MMSVPEKSDYLYGIDLIRFGAALSVAAFHLTSIYSSVSQAGWIGVEIFFVISGLVIANSAYESTAHRFAVSRFLRLYPGAWCVLLISAPLIALGNHLFADFGLHLTVRNVLNSLTLLSGNAANPVYWTLPIEISFYLLIYLLLRFGQFDRIFAWIPVLLISWSAPYLVLLWLQWHGVIHGPSLEMGLGHENVTLLRHGIYFGLGMLIWQVHKKRIGRMGIVFMALAIPAALLEIDAQALDFMQDYGPGINGSPMPNSTVSAIAITAFLFAFAGIVLSALFYKKFPANVTLRRSVRAVGLATYPLYLIHVPAGRLAHRWAERHGMGLVASDGISMICALALAFAVSLWCEPFLREGMKVLIRRYEHAWPLGRTGPAILGQETNV